MVRSRLVAEGGGGRDSQVVVPVSPILARKASVALFWTQFLRHIFRGGVVVSFMRVFFMCMIFTGENALPAF